MDKSYLDFLASKAPHAQAVGIANPAPMPAHMFDFQASVTAFALRQGRAGTYLDTGLGKTIVQLEWAEQSAGASNGVALILTPLAVARQMEREAIRFGYKSVRVIRDANDVRSGINICNYDRLDKLDPDAFGAVALDEADILCNFSGKTSQALKLAFKNHRFKLCATATPAPNDPTEIAEHAEFLGIMQRNEILSRWFINDTSEASQEWRLKGHAVDAFYDWMSSWARMAERPEDLGFEGSAFELEPFKTIRHRVAGGKGSLVGGLFGAPVSATSLYAAKRLTADTRAETAAEIVKLELDEPWMIWVDTDQEADAVSRLLPSATEVRGSHSPEYKEKAILDFQDGRIRHLITKPTIAGAGINMQHCARTMYVGRTFSYRLFYQSLRRLWRFGQKRLVHVHIIVSDNELQIGRVLDRKADAHATMKQAMRDAMLRDQGQTAHRKVAYNPTHSAEIPAWLKSETA